MLINNFLRFLRDIQQKGVPFGTPFLLEVCQNIYGTIEPACSNPLGPSANQRKKKDAPSERALKNPSEEV